MDYSNNQATIDDLTATCYDLGKLNEADGVYAKGKDCIPCLKELVRYLRIDDKQFTVRHTLGCLNIIRTDMIPIIVQHCNDPSDEEQKQLFDLVVKICVNLTSPALMFFEKQEIPDEPEKKQLYMKFISYLHNYKTAFADNVSIWTVLNKYINYILDLDFYQRTEEDWILFERIIIVIRNILHIPVDTSLSMGVNTELNAHDMCLYRMDKSGHFETLFKISESTEHGPKFCLHIMETVFLMLREYEPEALSRATDNSSNKRKRSDDERERDKKKLTELAALDKCEKHLAKQKFMPQRFKHGSFQVTNVKTSSHLPLVVRKPMHKEGMINFDDHKDSYVRPRNRRPLTNSSSLVSQDNILAATVTQKTSSFETRWSLKLFCIKFLENIYNDFMQIIKHNLVRHQSQENDETYYLWSFYFFTAFNRHLSLDIKNISETLSVSSLHYLQTLMDQYQDKISSEKKKYLDLSKRLHFALKAYKELLCSMIAIDKEPDYEQLSHSIKKTIFYEMDYRMLVLNLFHSFNVFKHTPNYLIDLIETNNIFLDLIQGYSSANANMLVKEKEKTKRARSKKKKFLPMLTNEEKEHIWSEISESITNSLENPSSLPKPEDDKRVKPYDAGSDYTLEEQKVFVIKRIHELLRNQEASVSVALFRNARNIWIDDEDKPFGDTDITISEEASSLQAILMADLEIEILDETGKDEQVEDEQVEDENPVVETEFNFINFVGRYCNPDVISAHLIILKKFKSNHERTNEAVIKMLERIVYDCGFETLLMQASILKCFLEIIEYKKLTGTDSAIIQRMIQLGRTVIEKMAAMANRRRFLFLEILFWKSPNDTVEIDYWMNNKPEVERESLSDET